MAEKIKKLTVPEHVSVKPVLIYQGNLSRSIEQSNYFSSLIAFADLLETS